ncbi:spondin domain-containing protein [Ferrimonas sp. SCSIO 43195]|uniref:spondin domain-containing protein n=1 Tax=Ferrimonas sp. SCSIO 43195 TaxID=2822844 RepID=UPI002075A9DE|nr:spondin domain-containing protein [Ferrimonas sp. SCSIO 43195]USD38037.1 spondin domain-containing protein [Ferrimonas sp. SCSIO 43195]
MTLKPLALAALLAVPAAGAQTVNVEITNLTQGIYFTPLLVSAHDAQYHLFQSGTDASAELTAMAEGGDIAGLVTLADSIGAVSAANPAQGLLAPAASTNASLEVDSGMVLSVTAMILPSNDGFVGLDSWPIPSEPGTYTINLNAYDAGTEANDEVLVAGAGGAPGTPGMPAIPGTNGGSGASGVTTEEPNTKVHIHRGNLGDSNASGGISDVDSRIHRWLNPVARITVTVQ